MQPLSTGRVCEPQWEPDDSTPVPIYSLDTPASQPPFAMNESVGRGALCYAAVPSTVGFGARPALLPPSTVICCRRLLEVNGKESPKDSGMKRVYYGPSIQVWGFNLETPLPTGPSGCCVVHSQSFENIQEIRVSARPKSIYVCDC